MVMKRVLPISIAVLLLMVGFTLASILVSNQRFDVENDGWVTLNRTECIYWVESYGLPIVPITASGGPTSILCHSQTTQRVIPCAGEYCNATAGNYAIALSLKNNDLIVPLTTLPSAAII